MFNKQKNYLRDEEEDDEDDEGEEDRLLELEAVLIASKFLQIKMQHLPRSGEILLVLLLLLLLSFVLPTEIKNIV
jgi:hypothetical protein